MAQKQRISKQITDREFDRLTEVVLRENKELLEMLAKV
jgi:hypothetical protein